MLDRFGETSFEVLRGVSSPGWIGGVLAGFAAVVCLIAFIRGSFEGRVAAVTAAPLLLVAGLAGWLLLDWIAFQEKTAEQRALEARVAELSAHAQAPGSALGCLDEIAGAVLGEACETALFANAASVAAAVAYVTAQLSLLHDVHERAERGGGSSAIVQVRRALETDRFGIVAHVLAARDGCTADRCSAFLLLRDITRVRANLLERPFEERLKTHAAAWLPAGTPATPTTAVAKPPNNLEFPSSASIPPVNIMTTEPAASPHGSTAAAEAGVPRKPSAAAPARQMPSGSTPARAPVPLAAPAGN